VERSGCEARSFLVLRLYDSKAELKMGTKLECEVDAEGPVDMMDRGEERDGWRRADEDGDMYSRRHSLRPITVQPTNHEARHPGMSAQSHFALACPYQIFS
jgi:hypothetical protein